MTEYFEVHARDGPARRGELRLTDPLRTPALVDDVLVDGGSRWPAEREVPEGDPARLTVLPHRGFPAGTRQEVQEAFVAGVPDADYPSAAVVAPETVGDHPADASVLSTATGVAGHAERLLDDVLAVRRATPPDTALYLPGVATPRNVAVLAYAGVDLFDEKRARVRGRQGRYLTTEGEYHLDDGHLDELPAPFPGDPPLDEFDRDDCVEHNVAALRSELATVRTRIADGRLRDYVEGQARHENWLTALVRRLDDEWGYVEERTPVYRSTPLAAATEDTLRRAEIRRFADRVTARYRPRFDDLPLVLVPCAARKPYSESQSHAQFHRAIGYRGHVVSVTSPIGAVPQELELVYPAQHYDTVVTGRWTAGEREFVREVLERYLDRADYPRVVAHVPADYRPMVEGALDGRDLPVAWTVGDHPTTDESLAALSDALDGEEAYRKRTRQHRTLRALADYQFGEGAGEALFSAGLRVEGRYPKLVAFEDDEQVAALVPQYGSLAFTLAGAERARSRGVAPRVEIDGFVPRGSVLAPGVTGADDGIRVGDEVVVEGPRALAVGRARMAGPEMAASTRGVAVDVRHASER
ncbi:MAG: archaeosine synthase subunit alpha [Haloferacaceae archaeon]